MCSLWGSFNLQPIILATLVTQACSPIGTPSWANLIKSSWALYLYFDIYSILYTHLYQNTFINKYLLFVSLSLSLGSFYTTQNSYSCVHDTHQWFIKTLIILLFPLPDISFKHKAGIFILKHQIGWLLNTKCIYFLSILWQHMLSFSLQIAVGWAYS